MAIYNLYSKQQKALKARTVSFRHDKIPPVLRTQILKIFEKIVGSGSILEGTAADKIYSEVKSILCHEYGTSPLVPFDENCPYRDLISGWELRDFFKDAQVDNCLDVIQVVLDVTKQVIEKGKHQLKYPEMSMEDGIAEINDRFREHGIGFQYVDGQIIRIDSELAHQEIMLPALKLLGQEYLKGANEEFVAALVHYRHGRNKECLNDCLKAFESTMKAICHKRGWQYDQNYTAKKLIAVCKENKLFPVFLENHLMGLQTTLENGVPTARNKTSGHGQGAMQITVSNEFAAYILNLTGTNILFLATSEQNLKSASSMHAR